MRTLEKSIVLVGMMGSGKSAVGRRLATALGMRFRDADTEIELAAGRTISEIFSQLGEAEFRNAERKVILRLLEDAPQVLATGGGAFMDSQLREAIKAKAISVWIKADPELLAKRVSRKNTRPLIKGGEPREVLERILRERTPIYSEADIVVETSDGPHETVVQTILESLKTLSAKSE